MHAGTEFMVLKEKFARLVVVRVEKQQLRPATWAFVSRNPGGQ